MGESILITGSSGFIGRNLVERLGDRYSLLTPKHSELDMTNPQEVKDYFIENDFGTVIHCASKLEKGRRAGEEGCNIVKDNLQMFFNLVANSDRYEHLINFGSGGEYCKDFEINEVEEKDFGKHIPTEDYAFSKYVMSKYIEGYQKRVNHLRAFAPFGKYEEYKSRFISNAVCKNILGMPITINQNCFFDYLDVDDLSEIVNHFIRNKPQEKFYNIGRGKPIDLITLAKLVNQIGDSNSKIIVKKEGLNREYTCSTKKMMNELGEFEFTPITNSIEKLFEYYRENIRNIKFGD